jgi:hypothetical protein
MNFELFVSLSRNLIMVFMYICFSAISKSGRGHLGLAIQLECTSDSLHSSLYCPSISRQVSSALANGNCLTSLRKSLFALYVYFSLSPIAIAAYFVLLTIAMVDL